MTYEALHELRNGIHACSMFAGLAVKWGYLTPAEADEVHAVLTKLLFVVEDIGASSA